MASSGEEPTVPQHDYRFKVVLIGDTGVGKTSLLLRFTENSFPETQVMNVGVDFKPKLIEVDGKKVYFEVWDTAGQERFRTISGSFYKGAHGILLVYDITDEETFSNLRSWLAEIDRNVSENSNTMRMLIGNKTDCSSSRATQKATASELAQTFEMDYQETSAKDDDNVTETFKFLARGLIKSGASNSNSPGVIRIGTTGKREKSSCCAKK